MHISEQEAETELSHPLNLMNDGEEIVIHRQGKPIARLVAVATPLPAPFGAMQGEFELPEGWDRPLSREEADDFWDGKLNLFDTRTFLRTLMAPDRLSNVARDAVAAGDSVLSVASCWEIVIKYSKGLASHSGSGQLVDACGGII